MKNFNQPQELVGQGDIRIIGDRASGKTTYLTALAYWPNHNANESTIQSIEPFDAETGKLYEMAQTFLEQGKPLAPTQNTDDPEDMPLYTFLIDLKPKFNLFNRKKNNLRIQLSCREYGGELFYDLTNAELFENTTQPTAIKLNFYLDDCASASGLMLLLEGQERAKDAMYSKALNIMKEQLTIRLANNNQPTKNQRIAIVLTKAEQGAVWGNRKDILGFLQRKFPKTSSTLRNWSIQWKCPIEYFVCSAFGIIPGVNKPNVQGGTTGTIAQPQFWKPFGLVSPLYWLYIGKNDPRLNDLP